MKYKKYKVIRVNQNLNSDRIRVISTYFRLEHPTKWSKLTNMIEKGISYNIQYWGNRMNS